MTKSEEILWVARTIEIFRGECYWGPYVQTFSLWEEVLAKDIPCGAWSGMQALRALVDWGSSDQAHIEPPQNLCLGAPIHFL